MHSAIRKFSVRLALSLLTVALGSLCVVYKSLHCLLAIAFLSLRN